MREQFQCGTGEGIEMRARGSWPGGVGIALLAAALSGCGGPAPRPRTDPVNEEALSSDEVREEYGAAARAAFVKGTYLKERGDLAGAKLLYIEAVRLAPRDAELRLALAQLELVMGHVPEAKAFLEGAVKRFGGSPAEHLLLARLQAIGGETGAALSGTEAALRADSSSASGWGLRARLLLDQKRFGEALRCFQRAKSLEPGDPRTLEGIGDCKVGLKKTQEAEAAYKAALALDPALGSARDRLAALLRGAGRRDEAEALYRAALEANPDDTAALESLLELQVQSGEMKAAAELLRPYHERRALGPRLTYMYARLLMEQNHLARADSVLRPLAQMEGVRGVEELLGDIALRSEHRDEAREHYHRAIAQQSEDCGPHVSLALLEMDASRDAKGHFEARGAASDSVRRSLQAAEGVTGADDYRCNLLLGIAYYQLRDFDAAVRHLEASRKLEPENTEILFNLAMAHQELGHYETALQVSKQLLKLDPNNAPALNFVGYILAEHGQDLDRSEALIRKALAKEPKNGYYVDSLGWVFYQKRDYERAASELERAVQLTEERDATILEHLGDAYVKAGRLDGAYRVYKLSQQIDPQNQAVGAKLDSVTKQLGKP